MMTVEHNVRFGESQRGRKKATPEAEKPTGHVPRVARLMALAIRFDQLIRDGIVADQAELARVGHVSRARLTQIMNLLSLAPEIQEELLFWQTASQGREKITEKDLRPISAIANWGRQRQMWLQSRRTNSNG